MHILDVVSEMKQTYKLWLTYMWHKKAVLQISYYNLRTRIHFKNTFVILTKKYGLRHLTELK